MYSDEVVVGFSGRLSTLFLLLDEAASMKSEYMLADSLNGVANNDVPRFIFDKGYCKEGVIGFRVERFAIASVRLPSVDVPGVVNMQSREPIWRSPVYWVDASFYEGVTEDGGQRTFVRDRYGKKHLAHYCEIFRSAP